MPAQRGCIYIYNVHQFAARYAFFGWLLELLSFLLRTLRFIGPSLKNLWWDYIQIAKGTSLEICYEFSIRLLLVPFFWDNDSTPKVLTWNLKMMVSKFGISLFEGLVFRGCTRSFQESGFSWGGTLKEEW